MPRITLEKSPNNEYRISVLGDRGCVSSPPGPESAPPEASNSAHPLTLDSNSKRPANGIAGYGCQGRRTAFGRNARHSILAAGGAIDKLGIAPNETIFLTGTLPGSTDEAMRAIAEWSGYIVHRLKAWLAKRVASKLDFYVWELQKRGALHLHYLIVCRDENIRKSIIEEFPDQWLRLLDQVSVKAGIDVYKRRGFGTWADNKKLVQSYAAEVTHSVAAYIAGYCGGGRDKHRSDAKSPYYPSRWWGVSRPLKSVVSRMSERIELTTIGLRNGYKLFDDLVDKLAQFCLRDKQYRHKFGIGKTCVIYTHPEDWESIWQEMKSQLNLSSTVRESRVEILIQDLTTRYAQLLRRSPVQQVALKRQRLEDALAVIHTLQTSPSRSLKTNLEMIARLTSCLPLQSLSRVLGADELSALILRVRMLYKSLELGEFRWDGSIRNSAEIDQALDNLEKSAYAGTSSVTGQGPGGGGHGIDDKSPGKKQVPHHEQLSLI